MRSRFGVGALCVAVAVVACNPWERARCNACMIENFGVKNLAHRQVGPCSFQITEAFPDRKGSPMIVEGGATIDKGVANPADYDEATRVFTFKGCKEDAGARLPVGVIYVYWD